MSNQPLTPELLLPHTQSEEAWEAKRAEKALRFFQAYAGAQKPLFMTNPLGADSVWKHFDFRGTEVHCVLAQATARNTRVPVTNLFLQWRAAESMRELVSCEESDVVDFAIMQDCHSYLEEIPGDFHFPAKRDLRKPPQWQPTEKREEPRKRTVNLKAKAKARAARKRRK